MNLPKELQDLLANGTRDQLAAAVEMLAKRAALRGVALMEQVEFHREVLELLRSGRISDAAELTAKIVANADHAFGTPDGTPPSDLATTTPAGSA